MDLSQLILAVLVAEQGRRDADAQIIANLQKQVSDLQAQLANAVSAEAVAAIQAEASALGANQAPPAPAAA